MSSPQLDNAARGFSFLHDGPLDMRMDNETGITAAAWLARAPEHEIAAVIRDYGEERFAKRIARAIVSARQRRAADAYSAARQPRCRGSPWPRARQASRYPHVPGHSHSCQCRARRDRRCPGTERRPAEARWPVVRDQLPFAGRRHGQAVHATAVAGRPRLRGSAAMCLPHARPKLRRIGKAIHPREAEIRRNPRARSAILRVAERLAA